MRREGLQILTWTMTAGELHSLKRCHGEETELNVLSSARLTKLISWPMSKTSQCIGSTLLRYIVRVNWLTVSIG